MNQDLIPLKIKTMDNNSFELMVYITQTVQELKLQIEKTTGIPLNKQRLIYCGKSLNNEETLLSYKIEQNQTVLLIANLSEVEQSPTIQRGYSVSSIDETELKQYDVTENRKQSRRKVLQQRLQGFPNLPQKPAQSLQQNLMTLYHMLSSFNSIQEFIDQGLPFQQREFDVGMWVDYKDNNNEWVDALIIKKIQNQYLIYHCKGEEWIGIQSNRIAYFRSHTIQKSYHLSPELNWMDNQQYISFGELLSQCGVLMTRVGSIMSRIADGLEDRGTQQKQKSDMSTLITGMIEEQRRIQEEKTECKDDVTSVKSMKSMKSDKISIDYETSSIKSMKSDLSKIITNYQHHYNKTRENITEEEEDSQDMSEEQRDPTNISKDSKENISNYETMLFASQIAPIADRLGRLLTDISPYLAMCGTGINQLNQNNNNNVSNLSIITNEGSQYSQDKRSYFFQVPVLLTPLELVQQQVGINRVVSETIDIINNAQKKTKKQKEEVQVPTQPTKIETKTETKLETKIERSSLQKQQSQQEQEETQTLQQQQQEMNGKNKDQIIKDKDKDQKKKKTKEVSFSQQIEDLKKSKQF